MQQLTERRIIKRPVFSNFVPDGERDGEIIAVDMCEIDSIKYPGTKLDAINFKVKVKGEHGVDMTLFHRLLFTWGRNTKFMETLENLEMVPAEGEELDIDAFVGMKVIVEVENREKDGKNYSNIINMTKRKPQMPSKQVSVKKVAPKPSSKPTEEYDYEA